MSGLRRHDADSIPSVEYLAQAIRLDAETGLLYWKQRPREHFLSEQQWRIFNATKPGKRADIGSFASVMYRRVRMNYRSKRIALSAHRVVFALVHGRWPENEVDHINRDRTDNRPCNLRDVTHSENMLNADYTTRRRAAA